MSGEPQENLEQLLSAYLDGELSEAQRRQVEARLREDDGAARRLLEELRATVNAVQSLPHAQAPAELMSQMRTRLERQALLGEQTSDRVVGEPFGSTSRMRTMAAAAVIALAFFAGYVIWDVAGRGGSAGTMPMASLETVAKEEADSSKVRTAAPAPTAAENAERRQKLLEFARRVEPPAPPPPTPPAAAPVPSQPPPEAKAEVKVADQQPAGGSLGGVAVQPLGGQEQAADALASRHAEIAPGKQAAPQVDAPVSEPHGPLDLFWLAQLRSAEQARERSTRDKYAAANEFKKQPTAAAAAIPKRLETDAEAHSTLEGALQSTSSPIDTKRAASTQPSATTQPTQPAASSPAG